MRGLFAGVCAFALAGAAAAQSLAVPGAASIGGTGRPALGLRLPVGGGALGRCGNTVGGVVPKLCADFKNGVYTYNGTSYANWAALPIATASSGVVYANGLYCTGTQRMSASLSIPGDRLEFVDADFPDGDNAATNVAFVANTGTEGNINSEDIANPTAAVGGSVIAGSGGYFGGTVPRTVRGGFRVTGTTGANGKASDTGSAEVVATSNVPAMTSINLCNSAAGIAPLRGYLRLYMVWAGTFTAAQDQAVAAADGSVP